MELGQLHQDERATALLLSTDVLKLGVSKLNKICDNTVSTFINEQVAEKIEQNINYKIKERKYNFNVHCKLLCREM